VHGGGFARGSKHTDGTPFYDNIGVWAAAYGLVGVTMNYRLAPDSTWPSGIEDVAAAVKWLQANAARYGGDPKRIFLWGHSAGAAHVGDYLADAATQGRDPGVAGAILTSGFTISARKSPSGRCTTATTCRNTRALFAAGAHEIVGAAARDGRRARP
jgi:triacylglycerol lipase